MTALNALFALRWPIYPKQLAKTGAVALSWLGGTQKIKTCPIFTFSSRIYPAAGHRFPSTARQRQASHRDRPVDGLIRARPKLNRLR
jgi:hypothetical protein